MRRALAANRGPKRSRSEKPQSAVEISALPSYDPSTWMSRHRSRLPGLALSIIRPFGQLCVCSKGGYLVVALHVLQRGDHGEAVVRRGQTGVLLALTQQVVDERGLACPPMKPTNQLLQACIRSRSHHTGGVVAHHQHHGHGGALARHHVAEVIQRLQHRVVQLRMNPRHPLGHQHSPTPAQRPRDGRTLSTSWVTWRSTVLGSAVCVRACTSTGRQLRSCADAVGEGVKSNVPITGASLARKRRATARGATDPAHTPPVAPE